MKENNRVPKNGTRHTRDAGKDHGAVKWGGGLHSVRSK